MLCRWEQVFFRRQGIACCMTCGIQKPEALAAVAVIAQDPASAASQHIHMGVMPSAQKISKNRDQLPVGLASSALVVIESKRPTAVGLTASNNFPLCRSPG